jgi:hypothetical protein
MQRPGPYVFTGRDEVTVELKAVVDPVMLGEETLGA